MENLLGYKYAGSRPQGVALSEEQERRFTVLVCIERESIGHREHRGEACWSRGRMDYTIWVLLALLMVLDFVDAVGLVLQISPSHWF